MSDDVYDPRLLVRGEGPPVILVPGLNGTGDLFYRQVPPLRRAFRVATYSLRHQADHFDELVADLAQIVEIVAPADRRATIIGESFGGALALSFALAHPDLVESLVILNSFPYFPDQIRLRLAVAGLTMLPSGALSMLRYLAAFRLHSARTSRADVRQFIQLTAHASRVGYRNRLKLLTRFDVRDRLGEIRVPTLFLAAECDHLVPAVEQAREMAARVPSSVVRILDGHGHICLIAPGVDLAAILHEWRMGTEHSR
ncbi:MAG: alpha/beta fold hydrolase [Vicinamibacterales bacterium]